MKRCRKDEGDIGVIPSGCQNARWLCPRHFRELCLLDGPLCLMIHQLLGTSREGAENAVPKTKSVGLLHRFSGAKCGQTQHLRTPISESV